MTPQTLAAHLLTMQPDEVRAFARAFPASTALFRCRDVYLISEALVLKLATTVPVCRCWVTPTCDGTDWCVGASCGEIHPEDEQPCYCPRVVEPAYSKGQNEAEALLWDEVRGTECARYFAQVYAASADGYWLLQERVLPYAPYQRVPDDLVQSCRLVGVGDVDTRNCGVRRLEERGEHEVSYREEPVIFDYGISKLWAERTGETHFSLACA